MRLNACLNNSESLSKHCVFYDEASHTSHSAPFVQSADLIFFSWVLSWIFKNISEIELKPVRTMDTYIALYLWMALNEICPNKWKSFRYSMIFETFKKLFDRFHYFQNFGSDAVTKFYFKDDIEYEIVILSNQKRQWIIGKREAIDKWAFNGESLHFCVASDVGNYAVYPQIS